MFSHIYKSALAYVKKVGAAKAPPQIKNDALDKLDDTSDRYKAQSIQRFDEL